MQEKEQTTTAVKFPTPDEARKTLESLLNPEKCDFGIMIGVIRTDEKGNAATGVEIKGRTTELVMLLIKVMNNDPDIKALVYTACAMCDMGR